MGSRHRGGPKPSLLSLQQPKLRGGPPQSHHAAATPLRATHPIPAHPQVSLTHGNAVLFYNAHEPYYEFTNFYPRPVKIMGKFWPSTEHFFQAQKFAGTPIVEKIRKCGSAREAFELARSPRYQAWLHPDWHKGVKDNVMLLAVKEKFSQHEDLKRKLLQTGEKEIIEHTTNDSYWGDGGGWGRGQNRLGKILMQVRSELREGVQHDTKKYLPLRSSSTERGAEQYTPPSRPRSRSVDRNQRRSTEYRYEHWSRGDGQPTTGIDASGRERVSRWDGSSQAMRVRVGRTVQDSTSTPQASRPASPSKHYTGRGNESPQMAGILNPTRCTTPWH